MSPATQIPIDLLVRASLLLGGGMVTGLLLHRRAASVRHLALSGEGLGEGRSAQRPGIAHDPRRSSRAETGETRRAGSDAGDGSRIGPRR